MGRTRDFSEVRFEFTVSAVSKGFSLIKNGKCSVSGILGDKIVKFGIEGFSGFWLGSVAVFAISFSPAALSFSKARGCPVFSYRKYGQIYMLDASITGV